MPRPLHGPPILQNQILGHCNGLQSVRIGFWAIATVCNPSESDSGPLQGSAIRQNQILDLCNGLQNVGIRFWAIATVCKASESDAGPLQRSAILQNQILGLCNGLQSSKIRFWAIATVCKASESDSGPLQQSAIRQNQILKSLPSMNHPVNPLLSSLFIVQFASLPSLEMGIAGRRARLHLCRAKKPKQPSIYNEKNSYASLLHGLLCCRHACHECQCD